MEVKNLKLFKFLKILLIAKVLIWVIFGGFVIFSFWSFYGGMGIEAIIIAFLMWGNALGFLILFWGISQKYRLFFYLTLGYTLVNIILTLADQFGFYDLLVLIMDLVIVILLLISKKSLDKKFKLNFFQEKGKR